MMERLEGRQSTAKFHFPGEPTGMHYHTHSPWPPFAFLPSPASPLTLMGGLTLQKLRNVFQLGDVIFTEATVLFQKWENVVVLVACVGFIQGLQGPEHRPPCFLFFLRVFHSRDRLPTGIQA